MGDGGQKVPIPHKEKRKQRWIISGDIESKHVALDSFEKVRLQQKGPQRQGHSLVVRGWEEQ